MVSMLLGVLVVLIIGVLAYNYFRANRAQGPAATTESVSSPSGEIASGTEAVALPATHIVASGENLWIIAEKYFQSGYNYVDIASANNLTDPSSIEPGQKLTIPKVGVRLPLTVESANTPVITASRITGTSYTIVKGDDLWNIALRAYGDGYRWVDIAKANDLTNPSLIFSDNVLTLPRP